MQYRIDLSLDDLPSCLVERAVASEGLQFRDVESRRGAEPGRSCPGVDAPYGLGLRRRRRRRRRRRSSSSSSYSAVCGQLEVVLTEEGPRCMSV